MVPVLFVCVYDGEGQALYVDGVCVAQDTRLDALDILAALDEIHYTYGTASLSYKWFYELNPAPCEFPTKLETIPDDAWEEWNGPEPCEHCGSCHVDGSC